MSSALKRTQRRHVILRRVADGDLSPSWTAGGVFDVLFNHGLFKQGTVDGVPGWVLTGDGASTLAAWNKEVGQMVTDQVGAQAAAERVELP